MAVRIEKRVLIMDVRDVTQWADDPTENVYTKECVTKYTATINEWEQDFCSDDELELILHDLTDTPFYQVI